MEQHFAVVLVLALAWWCPLTDAAPLNGTIDSTNDDHQTVVPDASTTSVISDISDDPGVNPISLNPVTTTLSDSSSDQTSSTSMSDQSSSASSSDPSMTTSSAPDQPTAALSFDKSAIVSESDQDSDGTPSDPISETTSSDPLMLTSTTVQSDDASTADQSSLSTAPGSTSEQSSTKTVLGDSDADKVPVSEVLIENVELKSNEDIMPISDEVGEESSEDKIKDIVDMREVSGNSTTVFTDTTESTSVTATKSDFSKTTTTPDREIVEPSRDGTLGDRFTTVSEKPIQDPEIVNIHMKYVPPLNPMMFIASKVPELIPDITKSTTVSFISAEILPPLKDDEKKDIIANEADKEVDELQDLITTTDVSAETITTEASNIVTNSPSDDSLLKIVEIESDEKQNAETIEVDKSEPILIEEIILITTPSSQETTTEIVGSETIASVQPDSSNIPLNNADLAEISEQSSMTTENIDISESSSIASVSSIENEELNPTLKSEEDEATVPFETSTSSKATDIVELNEPETTSFADVVIGNESDDSMSRSGEESKDGVKDSTTSSSPETTFSSLSDVSEAVVDQKEPLTYTAEESELRDVEKQTSTTQAGESESDYEIAEAEDIDIEQSETTAEPETTTAKILTTIKKIMLSMLPTTSMSPMDITTAEETSPVPQTTSNILSSTESLLSIENLEISKSEAILASEKDPEKLLELSPIKLIEDPSLDIVEESKDTLKTTESPEVESTEELLNIQSISSSSLDENVDKSQDDVHTTTVSADASSSGSTSEPEPSSTVAKETEVKSTPADYAISMMDRYVSGNITDTVAAVQFLHFHDKASSEQCYKLVNAHWNYATNLTEENKVKQLAQTLQYSLFHKEAWKNATSFAWKSFDEAFLRRWFKSLSVLGTAALPEDKLNEFNKLKAEMKNTYSTAKICGLPKVSVKKGQVVREKFCKLTLEPDLQRIMTKSRDYDELAHVWQAWRDAAGKPIRQKYLRFVELSNEAARLNGFPDTGDMWREAYESETFEQDLENLWDQLRPLYEHLHAYVRRRLINIYSSERIKPNGPIPAHLFGNMWAQSWVSLLDVSQPFANKPSVDVTSVMEAKNLTILEMFKISEEFFTSLGLKKMPEEFWKHSLIEKPKDREIICHASAWDFCNGRDYRIKQCTDITMEDLITVHHEMGHIQYFLQYSRQPNVFREGANPGFHEAIGDVLALSVSTPKHLQSIELLEEVADDPEGDLNFLLRTALDKVSFLPSGYLIDLWRWGLFNGDIKPEEMNTKWWDLRLKYQGICPPVKRTDSDFDPGAKYHVPGNVPYIRYFVSFIIQFQFHKVLCDASGHTGPLYKCDIYRSKEAGQILSQVMELGSSEHWSEAMKIMTGGATNKMDASPILEYFEPLMQYLQEQNKDETIGWTSDDSTICP